MKISLDNDMKHHWLSTAHYFSVQSTDKFIKMFFPDNLNCVMDDSDFKYILHGPKYNDTNGLKDKIHILVCIENCPAHRYYTHYNNYGNYGNNNISIYFYNHIDKIVETKSYIAIPVIYTEINYFRNYYDSIKPSTTVPFEKKKFCVILSQNKMRGAEKDRIYSFLSKFGECDFLSKYKWQIWKKSCYHSIELLNVIQNYKFAFVCENSLANGYITEKIFNCFFSRCVPIYNGSPKIESYIDKSSFINVNNLNALAEHTDEIVELNTNEESFQKKINAPKINESYSDEEYAVKLKNFIDEKNTL